MKFDFVSLNILIVDDEPLAARKVATALAGEGHNVRSVYNAEAAVESVKTGRLDCILMDIDLGEGKTDGIEAAKAILEEDDIPLLFLSGRSDPETVRRAEVVPASGFVSKSSPAAVLKGSVNMAVRKARTLHEYRKSGNEFLGTLSEHVVNRIQFGLYIYRLEDLDDDTSLRMVFANKAAAELTGIPVEDSIGKTFDENFPNARSMGIPQKYAEVVRSGESLTFKNLPYYDDRIREGYFSVKAFSLPGHHIGVAFEDITEQKEISRALQKSERRYRNIFQNSFASIWEEDISALRRELRSMKRRGVSDFKSCFDEHPELVAELTRLIEIIDVNNITLEWYGLDKDEMAGSFGSPDSEESFERSKEQLIAIAEGRRFLDGESEMTKPDGTKMNFFFHISIPPDDNADESMIVVLTDVTKLKQLLEEKEYLMQELNHRVKNNLIMVSALISLKNSSIGDAADLSDLENRINAISFLHERLYRSDSLDAVNIGEYLEQIAKTVLSTFSHTPVNLITTIDPLQLEAKDAVSLGLILNELATNAIKHGYIGVDQPEFSIELKHTQDDPPCRLVLTNNGQPISDDFDMDNPGSLGIRLIKELVNGLGGTIEIIREPHPVFTISF